MNAECWYREDAAEVLGQILVLQATDTMRLSGPRARSILGIHSGVTLLCLGSGMRAGGQHEEVGSEEALPTAP